MNRIVFGVIAAIGLAGSAASVPAAASPMIAPSSSPLSIVDAFFAGTFFGGGGDGRNAYPWNVDESRPAPGVGCYFTEARVDNAWRRVQVCY